MSESEAKDRRGKSFRVKKGKSMKSFRGLITGKSRKEKKKAKADKKAALEAAHGDLDTSHHAGPALAVLADSNPEDETVYGAQFDDGASKMGYTVTSDGNTKDDDITALTVDALQIILLLMDPGTRRFELLQLEFDSAKSLVSDILTQIPLSATEETLRSQTFDCVCSTDGIEYDLDKPLSTYIDTTSVVIAAPKTDTIDSKSAAKMAKPILTDTKVAQMLEAAGVTIKTETPPETPQAPTPASPEPPLSPEMSPKEPVPGPPASPAAPVTPPAPTISDREVNSDEPETTEPTKTNFNFTTSIALIKGIILAYGVHEFLSYRSSITSPIQAGEVFAPGSYKSSCGLYDLHPTTACEADILKMDEQGVLSFSKNDEVVFSLVGNVCADDDESCVPGAVFEADGSIKIGGVAPKIAVKKGKPSLHPWPFAEDVGVTNGRGNWF